jgi:hypothetical protein
VDDGRWIHGFTGSITASSSAAADPSGSRQELQLPRQIRRHQAKIFDLIAMTFESSNTRSEKQDVGIYPPGGPNLGKFMCTPVSV